MLKLVLMKMGEARFYKFVIQIKHGFFIHSRVGIAHRNQGDWLPVVDYFQPENRNIVNTNVACGICCWWAMSTLQDCFS